MQKCAELAAVLDDATKQLDAMRLRRDAATADLAALELAAALQRLAAGKLLDHHCICPFRSTTPLSIAWLVDHYLRTALEGTQLGLAQWDKSVDTLTAFVRGSSARLASAAAVLGDAREGLSKLAAAFAEEPGPAGGDAAIGKLRGFIQLVQNAAAEVDRKDALEAEAAVRADRARDRSPSGSPRRSKTNGTAGSVAGQQPQKPSTSAAVAVEAVVASSPEGTSPREKARMRFLKNGVLTPARPFHEELLQRVEAREHATYPLVPESLEDVVVES